MLIMSLKDTALAAFRTLCAALCQEIYKIIALSYKLFMDLATFRLLGSKDMTKIYGRITMVLTIIMVFYITFEFVKYTIEPNKMTDNEKGAVKLPQKILFIIVLIAFVPNTFTYLHNFQVAIVKNDVITKIMQGKTYSNQTIKNDYTKIGNQFAWEMLNMFYETKSNEKCDGLPCQYIVEMNKSSMMNYGTIPYMTLGINASEKITNEKGTYEATYINFDPLWAVLVGGFIAYMLIIYCVDLGARSIQLLYLQVVSPIAIISILSPKKDNAFQKWFKQLLTTYLDVFIRLILINFVLLVSDMIINNSQETENLGIFGTIAIVLGLLVFAKRAPKLLGELFPSQGAAGGNFGLKPGDRNLGRVIGAALGIGAGAVIGAASGIAQGARKVKSVEGKGRKTWAGITGVTSGAFRGAIGGASRGLWNGAKKGNIIKNTTAGIKGQIKSNQQFGNRAEAGYTLGHQIEDTLRSTTGLPSRVEKLENEKAPLKRHQDALSAMAKTNDSIREHAFKKAKDNGLSSYTKYATAEGRLKRLQEDKDLIKSLGGEGSQAYQDALSEASKQMKKYKDIAIEDYVRSKTTVNAVTGKVEYKDGTLDGLFKERDQQLKDYNEHAIASQKIAGDVNSETGKVQFTYDKPDPNDPTDPKKATTITVDKYISEMSAEEFDEYIKQIAKSDANTLGRQIGEMTAEQEAIKRETAGSGIGGDKK